MMDLRVKHGVKGIVLKREEPEAQPAVVDPRGADERLGCW
jgi:hypothetical protein